MYLSPENKESDDSVPDASAASAAALWGRVSGKAAAEWLLL